MKGKTNCLGGPLRGHYYIVTCDDASTETFRMLHVILSRIAHCQSRVPVEGVVGDVRQTMAHERDVRQGLSN